MLTKNKQNPLDAYVLKVAKIDALLKRLQGACDDHFFNDPDKIGWGHVGDLGTIEIGLQELNDKVFHEGEYAPENKA